MKRIFDKFLKAYLVIIFIILYAPIAILVLFSFNEGITMGGRRIGSTVIWKGFSLEWYDKLFRTPEIWNALGNSTFIGIVTSFISAVLGTISAYALVRYDIKGKNLFYIMMLVPIIIPEITEALSLLLFYVLFNIKLGLNTIIIGHATFCIAYVFTVVRARLSDYDRSLEEAALSLGATPFQTFTKVTLPIIAPGILAGSLLAFTQSFDDLIKASFTTGSGIITLPMLIFSKIKSGVSPEINAIATITLIISGTLAFISYWISSRS
ncbi:MAG: ABC transporter permease [Nitrososphaeria archaeon]|nr:ABC transporter permease [Nitrososphaeria archaeon]